MMTLQNMMRNNQKNNTAKPPHMMYCHMSRFAMAYHMSQQSAFTGITRLSSKKS